MIEQARQSQGFRMRRLLVNLVVFLGSAAIGLLIAAVVLDNFSITATSFIVEVVIFAVLQLVLSRLILRHGFSVRSASPRPLLRYCLRT